MKWDWSYVYEELAAAFTGEPAPGVSFEVDGSDPRTASVRVRLRTRSDGYTYGFMSTHAKDSVGYVGVTRGVQKKQVAAALGISRWTLDRYLAEIEMENRATEVIG